MPEYRHRKNQLEPGMPRFLNLVAKRLSICAKEPIHYVTYGSGMQTWDACPQLAGFTEGSF